MVQGKEDRFGRMTVAQITDLHIVADGARLFDVVDTYEPARRAVEHVATLDPDVVLVTGDVTGSGRPEEYERARDLLGQLDVPYYVIPGNHDRRGPLLEVFDGHAAAEANGFVQYSVEDQPARLVALDTLNEGHDDGLLDADRLGWLEETLGAEPDRPTLIFMHHPPFETGVWWMDSAGLAGSADLAKIVGRHPQVKLIVCGHIHRPVTTMWAGTVVEVAPAIPFAVALDLEEEGSPKVGDEPSACLLHVLDGDRFVTHTSYAGGAEPLDLTPYLDWERLRDEWRERKRGLG